MTIAAAITERFSVPPELAAREPAERRGAGRDDVRLLASYRSDGRVAHHCFADLPDLLAPGDLVVVNNSATVPAALEATVGTEPLRLHLSTEALGGLWVVEPRLPDGLSSRPLGGIPGDTVLCLPGGGLAELLAPFPVPSNTPRLWTARLDLPEPVLEYLAHHGQPIRYGHITEPWPIEAYQTVFSIAPGSAEMPSAARPFTTELVTRLVARGVAVAPITLHTGVSSLESGEPPYPERFEVPASTARQVNDTRGSGRRVVAVGTTVVRALETVADESGRAHPGGGWTDLVVTADRGVRVIDGMLTGWHEPESSHLDMLEAVGGLDLVDASYRTALDERYLWHEFGDVHLILP